MLYTKTLSFIFDFLLMFPLVLIGDQLAIAKETGRRLGMGTNMYPSASLLGNHKDAAIAHLPVDELIEKADGFAGVFPGLFFHTSFRKKNLPFSL